MFTGIVEDMGLVSEWKEVPDPATPSKTHWTLVIRPNTPSLFFNNPDARTYIGASIAVSGVCLTVVAFDETTLTFGVAPETIHKTNFKFFQSGVSKVNIERAVKIGDRNSGHDVQGHVDGTAVLAARWTEGDSLWLRFRFVDKSFIKYVAPKGFIAVEGTSLTICDVDKADGSFTLMLIDHTQSAVVIPLKQIGEHVNIEVDLKAKLAVEAGSGLLERVEAYEKRVEALEKRVAELEAELPPAKRTKR